MRRHTSYVSLLIFLPWTTGSRDRMIRVSLLLIVLASATCFRWGSVSLNLAQLSSKSIVMMTAPPPQNFEIPFADESHQEVAVSYHSLHEIDNYSGIDSIIALVPLFCLVLLPQASCAEGGDFGIFIGRTASMLHPVTNLALFATSLYSAYLGWQWRRLRGLSLEIKNLNNNLSQLTTTRPTFPVKPIIETLRKDIERLPNVAVAGGHSSRIALIEADIRLLEKVQHHDQKYLELTAARDSLKTKNLKDKHHYTGSILLGVGVSVSILGALYTYMRAGRLFPGPHLYAGIAITILWTCT
ncbi:DUF4079 domain-containing protein [archaeon]|nr:MAG: DUF4079 domain-containing protein [archaeon]